jgi:hypothetical protein
MANPFAEKLIGAYVADANAGNSSPLSVSPEAAARPTMPVQELGSTAIAPNTSMSGAATTHPAPTDVDPTRFFRI